VYWPDCYDWGFDNEIRALISLRRRAGIVADSGWTEITEPHSGFAGIFHNSSEEPALAVSIGSDWKGPIDPSWKIALEKPGEYRFWIPA
jgi:hypothetical protein